LTSVIFDVLVVRPAGRPGRGPRPRPGQSRRTVRAYNPCGRDRV